MLLSEKQESVPTGPTPREGAVMRRETYLLKICLALMTCGAPTYRLEEYMHEAGEYLEIHLQSFYVPGCMVISFNDGVLLSKDVHIVRAEEFLNLRKLDDVHGVCRDVIQDKMTIEDATSRIDEIMA